MGSLLRFLNLGVEVSFTSFRASEDFMVAMNQALWAWKEANKVPFTYYKCILEHVTSKKVRVLYRGIVTDHGIYDHYQDLKWVRGEDGAFQFTPGACGGRLVCPNPAFPKSVAPIDATQQ